MLTKAKISALNIGRELLRNIEKRIENAMGAANQSPAGLKLSEKITPENTLSKSVATIQGRR